MIKTEEKKTLKRIKSNWEYNIKSVLKKERMIVWTDVYWFEMVTTDGYLWVR